MSITFFVWHIFSIFKINIYQLYRGTSYNKRYTYDIYIRIRIRNRYTNDIYVYLVLNVWKSMSVTRTQNTMMMRKSDLNLATGTRSHSPMVRGQEVTPSSGGGQEVTPSSGQEVTAWGLARSWCLVSSDQWITGPRAALTIHHECFLQ